MTAPWTTIVVVAAVAILLRAAGPALLGGQRLAPKLVSILGLLAPALLAALIATQVFSRERGLAVDERSLGLVVAGLAICARFPSQSPLLSQPQRRQVLDSSSGEAVAVAETSGSCAGRHVRREARRLIP